MSVVAMARPPAADEPGPADLMAQARRGVTPLCDGAAAAGDWDKSDREAVISGLDELIRDLTVCRGKLLLAHRDDGTWGSTGDRDFVDWRSRQTGAGRGAAMGELDLAETLTAMPKVAAAVDSGDLSLDHVKTLGRLQRQSSAEVQQAMGEGGLDDLVEQAAAGELTAPELGRAARAWAATTDADAAQRDFEKVRRRRSLTMRHSAGGVTGEFFLDAVTGTELRTALDAVAGAPAANEQRTREQRMADALSQLAGRALQVGSDLNGAQVRPHLSLFVSEETWTAILARRRTIEAARASGAGGSCGEEGGCGEARCEGGCARHGVTASGTALPPWPDVAPGRLEDGTTVPVGELERLMCDCEITRMVMTADGVPLDVGRTQRTYSKELRRAVTARDRRCQWPTCRLRASWCEVHHITWFSRGGVTSLDEGITLCSFHHHRVHESDVRITALSDGFDFHDRDGRCLGTSRRGGDVARTPAGRPADLAGAGEAATPLAAVKTVRESHRQGERRGGRSGEHGGGRGGRDGPDGAGDDHADVEPDGDAHSDIGDAHSQVDPRQAQGIFPSSYATAPPDSQGPDPPF